MPLELPISNFKNWKKQSANYYYPKNADGDNHIHVACTAIDANKGIATIKSVSIKVAGKSTNLRPKSTISGVQIRPGSSDFPGRSNWGRIQESAAERRRKLNGDRKERR
jgi:hypothetical protein